jgi:uncharacterized membrane protein
MDRDKLRKETADWVEAGIITDFQAQQIINRYPADEPLYRRMSFWLKAAAALLAGLALFLVLSENWQHLHWGLQSGITALPLVLAQLIALRAEIRGNATRAEVAWFFGSLALGANIMMQAQIFHISAYYPNGILFWVIGILPLVIFRFSLINFILSSVLFNVYLSMQLVHSQFSWMSLVPMLVVAFFTWNRQRGTTYMLFLSNLYFFCLTVLSHWNLPIRGFQWEIACLFLAVSLLQQFTALAAARVYQCMLALFGIGLFINLLLTFKIFAERASESSSSLGLYVAGAALLALAINWRRTREKKLLGIVLVNLVVSMAAIFIQSSIQITTDPHLYITRISTNVAYVISISLLLFEAIHSRRKFVFLTSIVALLVWAMVRYIDLFSNYLVTALIFVVSALALVLANRLWEKKYEI